MCADKNTSLTHRLKPNISVLAVQFSVDHLLLPLMLQATSLPLGFVPTAAVDIPWYMISNVTILPGSYGNVIINVILNWGHVVGTNWNQHLLTTSDTNCYIINIWTHILLCSLLQHLHCGHSYEYLCIGSLLVCSHSQHRPLHSEGLDRILGQTAH